MGRGRIVWNIMPAITDAGILIFDDSAWVEGRELTIGPIAKLVEETDLDTDEPTWKAWDTEVPYVAGLFHGCAKFKWVGSYPIVDAKFMPTEPYEYHGECSPQDDLGEVVRDWPVGTNRFVAPCQLFDRVSPSMEENSDGVVEVVPNCVDEDGNDVIRRGCVPCDTDGDGEFDNWRSYEDDDGEIAKAAALTGVMPMDMGGIYIAQVSGAAPSSWDDYQILTSAGLQVKGDCFGGGTDGIVPPNEWGTIFILMCIPWGVCKGGARSIGLDIDGVSVELGLVVA